MQDREPNYDHHQYHYQNHHHLPPPHLHSFHSNGDSNSNSTKITDYVTNHEIKFTKTEGCTPSACVCVFIAILFVSIAATSGIYFGLRSYDGKLLKERVFKGQFTIVRGESYTNAFENPSSAEFIQVAKLYANKIDKLYNESQYAKIFNRSEIIALEKRKKSGDDVIVHFNLHLSPHRLDVDAADLFLVLGDEVLNNKKGLFKNITIDYDSIDLQERRLSKTPYALSSAFVRNPWEHKTRFPGLLEGLSTQATPEPRRCAKIGLTYCNSISYNKTSYPNVIGHWNISSVEEDYLLFRQIVDFECYPLAREFMCRLLQPECEDDEMIWPCKDFCKDFIDSCESWIPKKLQQKINCNDFPIGNVYDNEKHTEDNNLSKQKGKKCKTKPGCSNELYTLNLSKRICDGIIDCNDFSDENHCDYCSKNQFHCGNKQCVDWSLKCDSKIDCANGADEYGCIQLTDNIINQQIVQAPHKLYYKTNGYLLSNYKGQPRKVCMETFLNMSFSNNIFATRQNALSICQTLNFRKLIKFERRSDISTRGSYVQIDNIGSELINVKETPCNSKQVLFIECDEYECGYNPMFLYHDKRISNNKGTYISMDGDWPWYGYLTRDQHYACDGTLVSNQWLLTSYSCFNDQLPSKTITTLGSVRLNRKSPISSEQREITALVHSQSGFGDRLTLVRLEERINSSNYIRPVCLTQDDDFLKYDSIRNFNCYTLSWDTKNDQLNFIHAKIVHSDECLTNSKAYDDDMDKLNWCIKLLNYDDTSCHGCNVPGRPLYCNISSKWQLVGIENYSLAQQNDNSQPNLRWFSKISIHHKWMTQIMDSFNKQN